MGMLVLFGIIAFSVDLSYTIIILMGLSLFGGGVATTAGGIKLLRISILFSTFQMKLEITSPIVGSSKK